MAPSKTCWTCFHFWNEESVLIDDTNCPAEWCIDDARDKVISDGHYEILLRLTERRDRNRGVTVMRQKAKWTHSAPILPQVTISRGWSDIVKCDSVPRSYYSSGSWVHHTKRLNCARTLRVVLAWYGSVWTVGRQRYANFYWPCAPAYVQIIRSCDNGWRQYSPVADPWRADTIRASIAGAVVHSELRRDLFLSKLQPFRLGWVILRKSKVARKKPSNWLAFKWYGTSSVLNITCFPFPETLVYEPQVLRNGSAEFVDHVDAHGYLCNLTNKNTGMVCGLPGAPKKIMYSYSPSCCMLDSTCSQLCCDNASNPSACVVRAADIRKDASFPRDRTMKKAECEMQFAHKDKSVHRIATIHSNFNFHPQNTAIEVCIELRLSFFHHCTKVVVPGMVKLWLKEAYKLLVRT